MKLTWFGGTTFRINIGGAVLVTDAVAIDGIEPAELVSGADRVFGLEGADFASGDPARWLPRRVPTLIDTPETPVVEVLRLTPGVLLVDAVREPPLVIATRPPPTAGRWGRDAVVLAVGADALAAAAGALETMGPRLIVVAAGEEVVDAVLGRLGGHLADTGFIALEAAMALEI